MSYPASSSFALFQSRLFVLLMLILTFLAACSSRSANDAVPPAQKNVVPPLSLQSGQYVFIHVSGQEASFRSDLESMLLGYLQSEYSVLQSESRQEADLCLDIHIDKIFLASTQPGKISATQALHNSAIGTILGVSFGAATGSRTGALIGAGSGLLLGLGVTAADTKEVNVWAMQGTITAKHARQKAVSQDYTTAVADKGLTRQDALHRLKDTLTRDILAAVRH